MRLSTAELDAIEQRAKDRKESRSKMGSDFDYIRDIPRLVADLKAALAVVEAARFPTITPPGNDATGEPLENTWTMVRNEHLDKLHDAILDYEDGKFPPRRKGI